jgi:hypothetical protein
MRDIGDYAGLVTSYRQRAGRRVGCENLIVAAARPDLPGLDNEDVMATSTPIRGNNLLRFDACRCFTDFLQLLVSISEMTSEPSREKRFREFIELLRNEAGIAPAEIEHRAYQIEERALRWRELQTFTARIHRAINFGKLDEFDLCTYQVSALLEFVDLFSSVQSRFRLSDTSPLRRRLTYKDAADLTEFFLLTGMIFGPSFGLFWDVTTAEFTDDPEGWDDAACIVPDQFKPHVALKRCCYEFVQSERTARIQQRWGLLLVGFPLCVIRCTACGDQQNTFLTDSEDLLQVYRRCPKAGDNAKPTAANIASGDTPPAGTSTANGEPADATANGSGKAVAANGANGELDDVTIDETERTVTTAKGTKRFARRQIPWNIFCRLYAARGECVTVAELICAGWPDAHDAQGEDNLHPHLTTIKSIVGPLGIAVERHEFNPAYRLSLR